MENYIFVIQTPKDLLIIILCLIIFCFIIFSIGYFYGMRDTRKTIKDSIGNNILLK